MMNCRNVLVLAAAAFLCACGNSGIPGVSESHITANVPNAADFRPFLIRDLTQYLKDTQGTVSNLVVEYELLRDEPSQAGVSYPILSLANGNEFGESGYRRCRQSRCGRQEAV